MSTHLKAIDALGTRFLIEVFDEVSDNRLEAAHSSVQAILQQFEHDYSRFRSDSLVSQLNQTGALSNPPAELLELLRYGLSAYRRTNGVFNMMVGAKLVESGYDANYSFVATAKEALIPSPHAVLHLTPTRITLDTGHLDLGGFGKGYVIDVIAKHLAEVCNFKYFLVNGGGDMYGTSNHDVPILLYLEHPLVPNTYLATTTITNQGFAASSPHKRAWKSGGQIYTHIIDTLPNEPASERPDATFITAPSALDADMFATVALLMPPADFALMAEREQLGTARFNATSGVLETNETFFIDAT